MVSLVRKAVPFLSGLACEHSHPDNGNWTAMRFQHLLRRMDQVGTCQSLLLEIVTTCLDASGSGIEMVSG